MTFRAGARPELREEDEEQHGELKERQKEAEQARKKQEQVMMEMHAKLIEDERLKVREREIVIEEVEVELRTIIAASQIFELELQDVVDELREAEEERQRLLEEERERLAWMAFWNGKASLDKKRRGSELTANNKQQASSAHRRPPHGRTLAVERGKEGRGGGLDETRLRSRAPSKFISPREIRAKRNANTGARRTGDASLSQEEGRAPRIDAAPGGAVQAHERSVLSHDRSSGHSPRQRGGGQTHRLWDADGGSGGINRMVVSRRQGDPGNEERQGVRPASRTGLPAILTPRERALACFRGSPCGSPCAA